MSAMKESISLVYENCNSGALKSAFVTYFLID